MSDDERRALPPSRLSEGSQAIDLLDLVRAAEDEALVAAKERASSPGGVGPVSASVPTAPRASEPPSSDGERESFVDVGDEAIDAPPTMPPTFELLDPAATGVHPTVRNLREREERRVRREEATHELAANDEATRELAAPERRTLPPAMVIALMVLLAAAALALIAR